jgi:hypothetical protein
MPTSNTFKPCCSPACSSREVIAICPWRTATQRLLVLVCAWLFGAGVVLAQQAKFEPPKDDPKPFLAREQAEPQVQDAVTVSVAALRAEDSLAVFGLPLAALGVQPVWVRVDNHSDHIWRFLPVFMDRDYFSPHEVAWMFRRDEPSNAAIRAMLSARAMPTTILPGATVSGYVFTNLTLGFKVVNVELIGEHRYLQFDFAHEQPGGRFDFRSLDPARLYPASSLQQLSWPQLRAALQALPCCTRDRTGNRRGDPLNLVLVGEERDVLAALVRGGWDFTDTVDARSVERMVSAFVRRGAYRNAPVSALYFEGRAQDFAMQRARGTVSQRNHLRLWLTPLSVDGRSVWAGQISRDIGVRVTNSSPTLTTHAIDPDIDEARDYLLQDALASGVAERWGLVPGTGAASADRPNKNLTGDPYYTDGMRLVLVLSRRVVPLSAVASLPE